MASPYINRFLSADTVVPNASDPQAFNRYSYVYNNPLRYIDPSGHGSVCGFSYSDPDCPPVAPKTTTVTAINSKGSLGGKTGGGGGGSTVFDPPVIILNPDPLDGGLVPGDTGGGIISEPESAGAPKVLPSLEPTAGACFGNCLDGSYGSLSFALPPLPPSPFACEWLDCGLSVASLAFSIGTFVPGWGEVAFGLDIIVTGIALVRTYGDWSTGEISTPTALGLGVTGLLGLVPGEVGLAFSFLNLIVTGFGFPEPLGSG